MHILSLITSFTTGGAEMLVTNLSGAFVESGHTSTVAALCDAGHLGNCPNIDAKLREKVRSSGGEARSLGLSRRRGIFAGARALRRLLAETRPDVIHAHSARVLPMLWLARPDAPVVLTHHNTRFSFPTPLFGLFDRIVRGYVAISRECADLIAPHVRRPISVIANAAGQGFRAAGLRTAPGGEANILSVGALSAQKDYETLVRAAAPLRRKLANTGRSARIRIAGGGDMLASLRSLVASEGVRDMVELLGARDDIPALLAEADLFVNCSLYEGFPIAIIEAMNAALPIVATDVAGNRALVRDGYNGLLRPHRDPEALATAIDAILSDADGYAAMSSASLTESEQYSIDRSAREHLQCYVHACGSPSLGRLPANA